MQVELGGCAYELSVDGERVEGYRERVSAASRSSASPSTPDAWVAALTTDLQSEAQRSAEARTALERLLG